MHDRGERSTRKLSGLTLVPRRTDLPTGNPANRHWEPAEVTYDTQYPVIGCHSCAYCCYWLFNARLRSGVAAAVSWSISRDGTIQLRGQPPDAYLYDEARWQR